MAHVIEVRKENRPVHGRVFGAERGGRRGVGQDREVAIRRDHLARSIHGRTGARFDAGEGLGAGGPATANSPANSRGEQ